MSMLHVNKERRKSVILETPQLNLIKNKSFHNRKTVTFNQLPNEVIVRILHNLNLDDLLNVNQVSHKIHDLSYKVILHNLQISKYVQFYRFDQVIESLRVYDNLKQYGTVINSNLSFLRLVWMIMEHSDKNLWEYINELSFGDLQKNVKFKNIYNGDSSNENNNYIWDDKVCDILRKNRIDMGGNDAIAQFAQLTNLDILQMLLAQCTNLKTLYIPSLPIDKLFSLQLPESIDYLTVALRDDDHERQHTIYRQMKGLKKLKKLHIKFEKNTGNQLHELSYLIKDNITSLQNLTLEFVRTEFNEILDIQWTRIFDEIKELPQGKLSLKKLKLIECNISNKPYLIFDLINESIELSHIEELSLSISETRNFESSTTSSFINCFENQMTNLKRFEIKPTKLDYTKQLINLIKFLKAGDLISQITHLDLHLFDDSIYYNYNYDNSEVDNTDKESKSLINQLIDLILVKCTKNLQYLRLFDEFKSVRFEKDFKMWFQLNQMNSYYEQDDNENDTNNNNDDDDDMVMNNNKIDVECIHVDKFMNLIECDFNYLTLLEKLDQQELLMIILYLRNWMELKSNWNYLNLLKSLKKFDKLTNLSILGLSFKFNKQLNLIDLINFNQNRVDLFCYI